MYLGCYRNYSTEEESAEYWKTLTIRRRGSSSIDSTSNCLESAALNGWKYIEFTKRGDETNEKSLQCTGRTTYGEFGQVDDSNCNEVCQTHIDNNE